MKKFIIALLFVTIAAVLFWMVGCNQDSGTSTTGVTRNMSKSGQPVETPKVLLGGNGGGATQGQSGTTLSSTVTIECFNYFDWTFSKTIGQGPYILCKGAGQDVIGVVSATKGDQHSGFKGTVCVTNGGDVATADLRITVTLVREGNCPHGDVAGPFDVDVTATPNIAAGDNAC